MLHAHIDSFDLALSRDAWVAATMVVGAVVLRPSCADRRRTRHLGEAHYVANQKGPLGIDPVNARNEILTRADAVGIWKRYERGRDIRRIADGFPIAPQCVQDVLSGKRFSSATRIAHVGCSATRNRFCSHRLTLSGMPA